MIAAIMQPTYLPWIGYLAMIDRSDIFVFLDDVQFARRSWQQRNRIKTAAGIQMLTIPVFSKGLRDQVIAQTQIDWDSGFADKHCRAIELAYQRAPYFQDFAAGLLERMREPAASLADYNIRLIRWLMEQCGLRSNFLRSSEMSVEGRKATLLCSICHSLGATTYLSAPGSREYLDESDDFTAAGIEVKYHDYQHPVYAQSYGAFEPYMSAVDALFHLGPSAAEVIRSGVSPS